MLATREAIFKEKKKPVQCFCLAYQYCHLYSAQVSQDLNSWGIKFYCFVAEDCKPLTEESLLKNHRTLYKVGLDDLDRVVTILLF